MGSNPEKVTETEELSLGKVGVKPFGERARGGSGLGGHVVSQNGLFLRLQMLCTISIQMAPAGLWSQRLLNSKQQRMCGEYSIYFIFWLLNIFLLKVELGARLYMAYFGSTV